MTSPGTEPQPSQLATAIELFAVPQADLAALLTAHEAVCRSPHLSAWVAEQAARISGQMGVPSPGPSSALTPQCQDEVRAYLPVLVFAAVLPATLEHHRQVGVDEAVSLATLADVGRNLVTNRRWEGAAGLGAELTGWLTRHLHGALYQLGRLQFERSQLGAITAESLAARGIACAPGDPVLSVHIPARMGPLSVEACDESYALAEQFFGTHFPHEPYTMAACVSWLLDPQLGDYLRPDSNILAFQRRHHLCAYPAPDHDSDTSVRRFVFENPRLPDEQQPRRTTLERAVVDHIAAGRHWQLGRGWVPVARPGAEAPHSRSSPLQG